MLLKDALKYSDKVRRRGWRPECYLVVGDGTVVGENGSDCRGYYDLEIELERFDDWEPVPLPGDITILCRECGEEFYIEEQDCEGYNWTVKPLGNISLGIECPNCNTFY